MRTSLTRAMAGVAIATAAVAAIAGAADASSTSTPRKATTLLIVAAKTAITVGQVDTIGGVLKSHGTPLAHRIIVLDRFRDKKWQPIEEKFTGKFGGVGFVVKPAVSTGYKLVFRGGDVYAPTHSGVVVVRVNKPKTATALSIKEAETTIVKGSTDTITGGLTAESKALPNRWVWLAVCRQRQGPPVACPSHRCQGVRDVHRQARRDHHLRIALPRLPGVCRHREHHRHHHGHSPLPRPPDSWGGIWSNDLVGKGGSVW